MRVSNAMLFGNYSSNLKRIETSMFKLNNQISTQRRINMPSDDPVGTAFCMRYRSTLTRIEQYTANSYDASSWMATTDSAVNTTVNLLQSLRERVVDADSTTLSSPEACKALVAEIEEARGNIMDIANSTQGNLYIFGGERVVKSPYVNRATVSGESLDLSAPQITIDATNFRFNMTVDGVTQTIELTPNTYTGWPGPALEDLASDIRQQLKTAGFPVPVDVKVTPDNRLTFYAGPNPPDGVHPIVLEAYDDGMGFTDPTLSALGFTNFATTKEIVGANTLQDTVHVAGNVTDPAGWFVGNPVNAGADFIDLDPAPANSSATDDYYVGMPITIHAGTGLNQTRTITSYDSGPPRRAYIDKPWGTVPTATSSFSIDPNYNAPENSKFKIKVGNELIQEISLRPGEYTPAQFAQEIELRIQERGGEYANVQVSATNDNRLRIYHQNIVTGTNLPITFESGSQSDILWDMGIEHGIYSERTKPNYEGNHGLVEYQINVGVEVQINTVGDAVFDSIFGHIDKLIQNLKADKSNNVDRVRDILDTDIANFQADIERLLGIEGGIGARVNRMENNINRMSAYEENVTGLLSFTEDLDLTQAMIDLKMKEAAYQAALQSGARILPMTLMDYLR